MEIWKDELLHDRRGLRIGMEGAQEGERGTMGS